MNEAEDKKFLKEIWQLDEEIRKLQEEHSRKLEKWAKEKARLEKISEQSTEKQRKKIAEFKKEHDYEKGVKLWGEYVEVVKKVFKAEENLLDTAIKHFKTARGDYEELYKKNGEKEGKLYKRLKQFDDVDGVEMLNKQAELRMERMKGARLKKMADFYQKSSDSAEDYKKELKKTSVELMEVMKRMGEKLKWKVEKKKELEKEKDVKKKQILHDEIEKNEAEGRRAFDEYGQKVREYLRLNEKASRKSDSLQRTADILSRAKYEDELHVDIFIELQDMNEVTERTAEIQKGIEKSQKETAETQKRTEKIQERTERSQKKTARILERIEKNTSEDQQNKTAAFTVIFTTVGTAFVAIFGAIFGAIFRELVAIFGEIVGENWVEVLVEKIGAVWAILLVLLAVAMPFVVLFFSFPYVKRFYREIWSR